MKKKPKTPEGLVAWNRIPRRIDNAIRGLREKDLDLRGGSDGWSIRETVHHLVEANLVASNIIIAACALDGYEYDWAWVNPSKAWMHDLGYDKAKVKQGIATLRALCKYLSDLIVATQGSLTRKVKLNDAAGAARYVMTIEAILWQEVEHAEDHLMDIQKIRKTHLRPHKA